MKKKKGKVGSKLITKIELNNKSIANILPKNAILRISVNNPNTFNPINSSEITDPNKNTILPFNRIKAKQLYTNLSIQLIHFIFLKNSH